MTLHALCAPCERKEDRIADLEEEVKYLERQLRDTEDERDELQEDLDKASESNAEGLVALREWLDRRTGELKWRESTGGTSEHLRDLLAVLDVLGGDYAPERLPL